MKSRATRGQIRCTLAIFLVLATLSDSAEVHRDIPSNHKEIEVLPSAASLKMEGRTGTDGFDINAIEDKSPKSESVSTGKKKTSDDQPIILGATSKVAIVYSERKPSLSDREKNFKAPRVVYPQKQISSTSERDWRGVKVSSSDSYLDALEHSQTSKDPREGVISADIKPKIPKLIRRDYTEGPVYRHPHDHRYVGTKEPSSSYNRDSRPAATKNLARISYGGPTPEPFLPTPSDSYSLPVQSSANFNDDRNGYGFYGSPQVSYGSPSAPAPINRPSYSLPPPTSYGPPNNGYPPSGIAHQAYGPPPVPSSSYGAPYAIQDYSQHLPSLPSIDFSWPLALKLNAFTLAKILLKLVIFKMIVKFIALVCLLLFIPKLEIIKKVGNKDSDDSDDSRRLSLHDSSPERLNILTAFVTSSIEQYANSTKSDQDCTSLHCQMRKFITPGGSWDDYVRLFKTYVAEETTVDGDNRGTLTNRVDS